MKTSKYNITAHYQNHHIILNSLHHTCIILNNHDYHDFINVNQNGEYYQRYIDLGLYANETTDEEKLFLYNSRKLIEEKTRPFYRILTTTDCNAKCFYCYEKGISTQTMSKASADNIIAFINKEQIDPITIEWFGGEPLLNIEIIDYICDQLRNKHIKFNSKMITNGYLLNREIIDKAKNKWALQYIQITLDGTKKVYENVKKFSAPGAFERVIRNIDLLIEMNISVDIRLNYDKYNIDDIMNLITYLSSKYSGKPNVFVSARRLIYDDKNNDLITTEETDCKIINILLQSNLSTDILDRFRPRYFVCPAYNLKHYVIMPNGDLYKCSKDIANPLEKVGDVINGIDAEKECLWCSPNISPECITCNLLPLCNFGCRHEEIHNKKYCMVSQKYVEQILFYKLKTFVDTVNK